MRTRTLRIAAFCLFAAAAVVFAACGSSNGSNASSGGGTTPTSSPKAASVLKCLQAHGIHAVKSSNGTIHASGSVSQKQLSEALGNCAKQSGVSIGTGAGAARTAEVRHAVQAYFTCLKGAGIDTSSISGTPPAKLAEAARKCADKRPKPLAATAPAAIKVGKVQVGKIDLSHVKVKIGKIHIGKIHIGKLHIENLEKLGAGKSAEGATPSSPAN